MSENIVLGPFNRGLRNDRPPFMLDNDSFPVLLNAYQWRGRVKRKRGTSLLGRLKRQITITNGTINLTAGQVTLANFPIVPGSINITGVTDGTTYKDTAGNGILIPTGGTGTGGSINYATGVLRITAGGAQFIFGSYEYYPMLPVMGLEDFLYTDGQFPGTIAFDTVYSYNIQTTEPYNIYDVSYFKNPPASTNYPNYVPKATSTSLKWNGENYQQFWTTNYQNAMWTTNGIRLPFPTVQADQKIGMQYDSITGIVVVNPGPGPPNYATVTISVAASPAIVGDFVFINEINGMTGINFQTGYVIAVNPGVSITVELPNAVVAGAWTSGGIIQYLTTTKDATLDCIRWYDGDPINNAGQKGWVNFCPPLSQFNFSIAELPPAQYYLVGGRMILEFKDRLVVFGPVVQAATGNAAIGVDTVPKYLQDTVIYSQNGTPYYTSSFDGSLTGALTSAATVYYPVLVPANQTATSNAWFEDSAGFGGFQSAGLNQKINTVCSTDDILVLGLDTMQSRFVYTGNDITPFAFYTINSELGSASTFSAINMDRGCLTQGSRGYVLTSQSSAERFDLEIPDEVFQISVGNKGFERFTAVRDFINEWVYFTYNDNYSTSEFPNQTLLYNYRENTWGLFRESYTTYGTFRKQTGQSWLSIPYAWQDWNVPWESGDTNLLQPEIIAGNQQGFVIIRESDSTRERESLAILGITGNVITSPDHNLNIGDYIVITGALGTIGTEVNNKIFQVTSPVTDDTFILNPTIGSGTYTGNGSITRMYKPLMITKQFPASWSVGRKTRIGPHMYLMTKTINAQVQLLMFLSQDTTNAWNTFGVVPSYSANNSLIYSAILHTCPESTNLGLTPANTNLLNLTQISADGSSSSVQGQIWHRNNTSLIGDTVQIGITLSDLQMTTLNENNDFISQFAEVELMGAILTVNPSRMLS